MILKKSWLCTKKRHSLPAAQPSHRPGAVSTQQIALGCARESRCVGRAAPLLSCCRRPHARRKSDAWARGVPRLGAATHLPIAPSVRTATSGGSSSTGASDRDRAPCKGPDEILQHVHEFAHAATWLSRQRSAARCGVGRRADQCLDVTEVADVIRCMYGEGADAVL